jgi:hypothetical protein
MRTARITSAVASSSMRRSGTSGRDLI